jgi:hypothetical protein
MICPHCSKPIDKRLVRQAANKDAASGKGSRPGARGLIRNPAGRPKQVKPSVVDIDLAYQKAAEFDARYQSADSEEYECFDPARDGWIDSRGRP